MKKFIFVIIIAISLVACTRESDVKKYADLYNWDSYKITGYKFFACSKDDSFATGFVAKKDGKEFSGVVCGGWPFKNATLRLD